MTGIPHDVFDVNGSGSVFDSSDALQLSHTSVKVKNKFVKQLSRTLSTVSSHVNPVIFEESADSNPEKGDEIDDLHVSHTSLNMRKMFVRQLSNRTISVTSIESSTSNRFTRHLSTSNPKGISPQHSRTSDQTPILRGISRQDSRTSYKTPISRGISRQDSRVSSVKGRIPSVENRTASVASFALPLPRTSERGSTSTVPEDKKPTHKLIQDEEAEVGEVRRPYISLIFLKVATSVVNCTLSVSYIQFNII